MSHIRDKIRDGLYGSAADERESESGAVALFDAADEMDQPVVAPKRLIMSLIAEGFLIALIIAFPGPVMRFAANSPYVDVLVPFALGFIIGFAAYVMVDERTNRERPVDSGVMSGFSGYDSRQRQFKVWIISTAAGVANVIFFFVFAGVWTGH